jgi:hypothetical protein
LELSDGFGWNAEGITYGAHDFEAGAFGFACFEQVDGAEGDVGFTGEVALAQELAFAECGEGQRWRAVHLSRHSTTRSIHNRFNIKPARCRKEDRDVNPDIYGLSRLDALRYRVDPIQDFANAGLFHVAAGSISQ